MPVARPAHLCHIAFPMSKEPPKDIPHNVMQDYFESLAETGGHPDQRLGEPFVGQLVQRLIGQLGR